MIFCTVSLLSSRDFLKYSDQDWNHKHPNRRDRLKTKQVIRDCIPAAIVFIHNPAILVKMNRMTGESSWIKF